MVSNLFVTLSLKWLKHNLMTTVQAFQLLIDNRGDLPNRMYKTRFHADGLKLETLIKHLQRNGYVLENKMRWGVPNNKGKANK